MKRINFSLSNMLKKVQIATLLTVTMLGMSTMAFQPKVAAAVSLGAPYDCDANSVLWCGAGNTSTILNKYDHGDGHNSTKAIQAVYSKFGISRNDIAGMGTTAVAGSVNKNGNVYVGNQVVATDALTAGRQNIAGSQKVTYNGVTFYTRKPLVSFHLTSLTAYVVMQNGQFKFAIMSSCGNPIKATPKTPQKGELACTQLLTTPGTIESNGDQSYTFTAQATATNANISKYVFNLGSGHNTQTVNTSATKASTSKQTYTPGTYKISVTVSGSAKNMYSTAPSPATCSTEFIVSAPTCTAPNGKTYPKGSPNCETCQYDSKLSANDKACVPPTTPTPPSTPTTTVLPNTGAGNVIGMFLGVSILGGLGYHFFTKRRLARR